VLEERHSEIARGAAEYVGIRHYLGNGVESEDRLVTTFELMMDAAFVRERFRPIEIFNHVTRYRGRTVDFDTFLLAQARHGRTAVVPIDEEDMVHPSQMICQFTDHMAGRLPALEIQPPPHPHSHLSSDPSALKQQREELNGRQGMRVRCFGQWMDLDRMSVAHSKWLTKQAARLERAVVGAPRTEVVEYFAAIERIVARTGPGEAEAVGAGRSGQTTGHRVTEPQAVRAGENPAA
jgi:hypothetical protein